MPFAKAYLDKVSLDPRIESQPAESSLNFVVTIPVSDEPELINCLQALRNCTPPAGSVEVIVALNSAASAPPGVLVQNRKTEGELREFIREHSGPGFRVLYTHTKGIRAKFAGAGNARKIAMDLALSRFEKAERPEGIMISLDADTLCEPDYLVEIEKHFRRMPSSGACSIYFEHPLEGTGFPQRVYTAITEYELHMRYYIEGLRYAGHPHAYHTLGSAFCIRAGLYASQGGMNRRTAGEDFYFLQKIIPLGNFHELNSTCLHPSPRPSSRVAFGTGPVVKRFLEGRIRNLETFNPRSFLDLKKFIRLVPLLYQTPEKELRACFQALPESLRDDLQGEFFNKLREIRNNAAGETTFIKRFFMWFNRFRILKFQNHAHRKFYQKLPVQDAVLEFLNRTNENKAEQENAKDLLIYLRKIQRAGSWAG